MMSSKVKSSHGSRWSNYYPTSWSKWAWSEEYQCNARYREVSEDKWEYEYEYAEPPEPEKETRYTPRDGSTFPPASLPAVDEDALPVEPFDGKYRHDEGVSDLNRRMAETSIESQSEVHQYSAGRHYPEHLAEHQYSAEQQYPGDDQNAELEDYHQLHGDKRREKGSSEPQDHRRRDKRKEYSSNQEYFESSKTDPGKSKGSETKCPECSMTFPRSTELERHHKTVHLNNGVRPYECLVPGCPANVRSWTTMRGLRLHEKNWHGPHSCSVPGCSRRHPFGFSSEADLEVHQVEHSGDLQPDKSRDERYGRKGKGISYKGADTSYDNQNNASEEFPEAEGNKKPLQDSSPPEGNVLPEPSYGHDYNAGTYSGRQQQSSDSGYYPVAPLQARQIRTREPKVGHDELDRRFKVHRSSDFRFGRVFKVLWTEPVGSGGTEITIDSAHGGKAYHKVRRFVISSTSNRGHSICLPILTYGMQGVLKPGVHPEDHAVVYSSKRDGPYLLEREEGLMTKCPIRIEVTSKSHKLDPLSRLNYAKLYTVEHNVKVLFIGQVAKKHERHLIIAYNEAHPPLDPGPQDHLGSFEDLASFAEGADPIWHLREEEEEDPTYNDGYDQ